MFRSFTSCFISFLLTISVCSGQQMLFETSHQHQLVLKAGETPGQRNRDYILYTLAIGNAKPLSKMEVQLSFTTQLHFQESYGPFMEVSLLVDDIRIDGDFFYRQFDFSQLLIPDVVMAQLSRYAGDNNDPQHIEFSLQQNEWPHPLTLIEKDWIGSNQPSLIITQSGFSDDATTNFIDRVVEVNNYWASINLIDSLLTEIRRDRIDDSKQPADLFIYWDLCRKVNIITAPLAAKYANSAANGKLKQMHDLLTRMQIRMQTLFYRAIEGHDDTLQLASQFASVFGQMLSRQRLTAQYVEFQDADFFYSSGRLLPDIDFVRNLRRFDSTLFDGQATQMVYYDLIERGDRYKLSDDLTHALDYYDDARQLAVVIPEIVVAEDLQLKIINTQEGLLGSYFRIAARSVEAGNYNLADEYENKALEFRRTHLDQHAVNIRAAFEDLIKAYIDRSELLTEQKKTKDAAILLSKIDERAIDFGLNDFSRVYQQKLEQLHRKVYLSYVVEAEKYFNTGNYQDAASELSLALLYRQRHKAYLSHAFEADELQRQIREPVVKQIIQQGIEAFRHGHHDTALDNFLMAREEAKAHALTLNYSLDSLASLAAKPIIIKHIKSAHLKIWANDFEQAWSIYNNASMLRETFMLNADRDIKRAFDDLDQRFIQRICLNHQLKYNELIDRVEKSIRSANLDHLKPLLLEAIKLASDNPGCNIDQSKALNYFEEYHPYFTYRERLTMVLDLFENSLFENAVAEYFALDNEVVNYDLQQYNYTHRNLIQYLSANSKNELVLIAMQHFLEYGDAESALSCLKLLHKRDYRNRDLRLLQAESGRLVAVYDFEQGHRSDPIARVVELVGESRWFRYFTQAYLEKMNHLQQKP